MEITKREVILSISIITIGLILGIIISGKLSDRAKDKNSIYNKATHIESKELFEYAIRTNIGNAFVYGDLISLDPVTYDEIDGEYLKVQTTSRVTALTKAILSLLNGADVQGVGRMIFSREQSIYNQSQYGLWNNRNFEGIKSVIGVTISGVN